MAQTRFGICNFCDSICGLAIEHDGGRIVSIKGDKQDPFSRGHICPKGVAQQDLFADPDRLRQPVRRKGDGWESISWGEALDEVGSRIGALQRAHGRDSVALYFGNPVAHNYSTVLALVLLGDAIRTRNLYSANSVDALPRTLVSLLLYGSQAILPVPDIERTDLLLVLGANPAVSNGSILTAGDCKRRLEEIRRRGGRIIVLDPRRTETALLADEHLFIHPGSDALFLLAVLHTLFREGKAVPGRLAPMIDGMENLAGIVREFPPERVAARVGIGAERIRSLALDFASSPSAVCYGRMGTSTVEFGALTTWLVDVLNIVTGNLDRPGGAMFTTPAVDLAALARILGQSGHFDRWRSRVGGLPEFNGELPVAALADEIETPGPGQIRGLVTVAGNMVLSLPNGRRLDRALDGLEFMASVDFYVNETTRHANVILPPTSPLENDHYPMLEHAIAVRNTTHYAPAVFPKPNGAKHDWEILLDLAARIARSRGPIPGLLGRAQTSIVRAVEPRRILDSLLRLGPYRLSLRRLLDSPHGIDLGPLAPRLKDLVATPDKRIHLVPPILEKDLDRLREGLGRRPARPDRRLLLITRRTLRSINTWMHNSPRLVRGAGECTLMMSPVDARRLRLRAGGSVAIRSRIGRIEVLLEVTDEMMPGVVSLPFGWGHDRPGVRLSVAKELSGASMNDVVDESLYDSLSGVSVLDGIPVTVSAATAPRRSRVRRQP